jgi:hypothetical protein
LKNRTLALLLLLVPSLTIAQPVPGEKSEDFHVMQFTCPLGGATFKQDVGYYSLPIVRFADGSWLGDVGIDAQIPKCPENALVLVPDYERMTSSELAYTEFTPAQKAKLGALVDEPSYRALATKTKHERALWIAGQLGLPKSTQWRLLQRLTWTATDPAERKRLVARIAAEGPALSAGFTDWKEQFLAQYFQANALRELGRFEEASVGIQKAIGLVPEDAGLKKPNEANEAASSAANLQEIIEAKDDDRFPIGLSSEKWRSRACAGGELPPPYGPLTEHGRAACEKRRAEHASMENTFQEAVTLAENPAERDRLCASTPEDERSLGLAEACRSAQSKLDDQAGEEMVLKHAVELAPKCDANSARDRKGPLFTACNTYQDFIELQLGKLLVADGKARQIICPEPGEPQDRASFATMACQDAHRVLTEREQTALLTDTKALDAQCAATKLEDRSEGLIGACVSRNSEIRDEEEKHLAANPVALDAKCAATMEEDREGALYFACSKRKTNVMKAEATRIAADPKAVASRCPEPKEGEGSNALARAASAGEGKDLFLCMEVRNVLAQQAEAVEPTSDAHPLPRVRPIDGPPEVNIYHPESGINKVALVAAQRIVAEAKRSGGYPKRKQGDLY